MTIDTVAILERLIQEKNDRLSAISRRLAKIYTSLRNEDSVEKIKEYGKEVDELGAEVKQLMLGRAAFKAEINSFYKPSSID